MTPLKAIAAFSLGFGLLVGTGIALATTDIARAPTRDGYGVTPPATATSTHGRRALHGEAGLDGGAATQDSDRSAALR